MASEACEFKGCSRKQYVRGLCASHVKQLYRRGSREKLTPLMLEKLVKLPSVHVSQEAASALRKVDPNPYRATKVTVERFAQLSARAAAKERSR